MIVLPTQTLDQAKEFGLTVSQLCGSNDLMFTPLSSGESVQIEALTPDGKAFLALVEEEYAK